MSINAIICIDVETGGLNPAKNPITQIAYQAFELDTYTPILEYATYIKPYNDNLVYDQKAMEYTGITIDMLMNKGLDSKDVLKKICTDFLAVNKLGYTKKPIMLGHNIGFDVGFIQAFFMQHKEDIGKYFDCNKNYLGQETPAYLDTIRQAKQKWGNDPKMTKYNLGACCEKAGVVLTDAHNALNDVKATKDLFFYFTNNLRTGAATSQESIAQRFRKHFRF